eukprot:TRINITY_DN72323_c0_g1_i1.p1 TRINITY_DN72323_c0_g1~~TRINITY_DN72323_c0_g1_i1.p1  ORF type:complete len:878 (-),score=96.58 TRINITY_DN72323_c0_g1_i1:245-2569(-)
MDQAQKLCANHAAPLARMSLGWDLLRAVRSNALENHPCAAGLATALVLCATVRESGSRDALDQGPFDWANAIRTWQNRIPERCDEQPWCRPYLELMVAGMALRYCMHCLESSLWPINGEEINNNAMRWLYVLFSHPGEPPPAWQGVRASLRLRTPKSLAGAGVFAGTRRGAKEDGSGVSSLVHGLASTWSQVAVNGDSTMSKIGTRLFRKIFGTGALPEETGARGPLGGLPRAKVHVDDFVGPRRGRLRFYVYDLPSAAHGKLLGVLHGRVREGVPQPSTCDFGISPCTDQSSSGGAFSGYRPYASEATILAKLLSAPEGVLVDDPLEATFFVVPFLSSTWCFLAAPKCWVRCGGLRPMNALGQLLVHYNASTAHRHIFLASDSTGDLPLDLQMQPLAVSYGPSACPAGSGGPVIVPPPVTDELPLPGPREFASKDIFVFAADGVGSRPYRYEAAAELERWQQRFPHLFVVARRDGGPPPSAGDWTLALRRSVFCPVLPGDNTFRMRLFHAVLAGCVPVVVLFPGGGWYRPYGPEVERSLPFAGIGPGRVAWRGLSVELPFESDSESFGDWARRLVPAILQLSPAQVRQRQERLAEAAPLLRYDFDGMRPDAFTAMLDELAVRSEIPAAPLQCFDPRPRFNTSACVSGASSVEREELEVYGAVACCPVVRPRNSAWNRDSRPSALRNDGLRPGPSASAEVAKEVRCNLGLSGLCVGFHAPTAAAVAKAALNGVPAGRADMERMQEEAHIRSHVAAVLNRSRFDTVLPGEEVCAG